MKQIVQNLLEKAGKHTVVQYEGKKRRSKFDENFGKEKLDLIDSALGEEINKQLVLQKMNK